MQRSQGALEGGAPEQAPSRVLKRAVSYLERVKRTFAERPEVYRAFLAVMHAFKEQRYTPHPHLQSPPQDSHP
jgi:histone deacetylase complex regulatory component SIN3